MTTTTRATRRPLRSPGRAQADPAVGTGPIRRIIAGSLASGLAAAGVLTLVVFGGADEHVITGAALLGFALGWAVLAVLSTRMTDQPQRWALVPAAGLAATGLGLLALGPDDGALTAAGWAWPPVLLVLAIWMGVRVRRSLTAGRGRHLLYPVVAVMVAAAVGGAVETVALTSFERSNPMPGQSYDVGGYDLHLDCTGSGGPTVVLQSGLGELSPTWARIVRAVAPTTRVCAYDRAGQGWSDDAARVPDGLQAAADLHTLLDRAGEAAPFVLVGHSTGGSYAMAYATRYPEQVAGMVLLDATSPYRTAAGTIPAGPPGPVALLPSLSRVGIGRLLPTSFWSALPEPAAGQYKAFASSPRGWRNTVDETATLPALLTQARALSTLGSTPLVVLTAAEHVADPVWAAAHTRMAGLSTNSSRRAADATHAGLLDEEGGAEISADAIDAVVDAARTGTRLRPS
jgi:pimeloyl-ACP methyl ester carboxylesterase